MSQPETTNPFTEILNHNETLQRKLQCFGLPGQIVEFDPDEAEALGAFQETALSAEDAEEASFDIETDEESPKS